MLQWNAAFNELNDPAKNPTVAGTSNRRSTFLIAWRDDPDPFGTNWEWLYPNKSERTVEPARCSRAQKRASTLSEDLSVYSP